MRAESRLLVKRTYFVNSVNQTSNVLLLVSLGAALKAVWLFGLQFRPSGKAGPLRRKQGASVSTCTGPL